MEGLLLVLALALIIACLWYVSLIKKRDIAREALSAIDVQLKNRGARLPAMLEIASGSMKEERLLLEDVAELETLLSRAYDQTQTEEISLHLELVQRLNTRLAQLLADMDNYPELQSDNRMLEAIQAYQEVEEPLAAARRFYNSAVSEFNTAVGIFPGSIIASVAGVKVLPYYEAEDAPSTALDAGDFIN
ncbi:LemA family protein [Shewanella sp. AS16]|uniref:LemA family protein n=1 Tax=Shewanella sp. AS16 TaxID=2907625 RepID=UPI001F3319FF|nr:LemA family protein [Shewanella sp. AS16]MCE9686152.1 LemA family protein [Shewanella sp. AS16]